jgi:hypothetical protein
MAISYLDKIIPSGSPRWLMGQTLHLPGKEKFAGYKGKGLSWGVIEPDQLNGIDMLELWPDDTSTTHIPPIVATLPNLKTLIIPSWFVADLKPADLPAGLEALQVGVASEKKPKVYWNKTLVFPNIQIFDLGRVSSDFYAGCFTGLDRTLTITADNKKLSLQEIGRCEKLANLFLHKAASVADINNAGAPNLQFAGWMEAKNTDFIGLEGFNKVREVEIKWNKALTSLEGLEQLPQLEQLEIAGCPKLANLGDIASVKSLKWMRIIDCGSAWIPNDTELKRRFTQAGFEKIRLEPYGRHTLLEAWKVL